MKWEIVNIPKDRAVDFEARCKTMEREHFTICRFKRLGESGGYIGYSYAGPMWVADCYKKKGN